MLDKRAMANKDLYSNLEKETKDLISKMNMDDLRKKYAQVIEEVGMCSFSVADSLEAVEESDYMCIGLKVNRPEAAIADPSKLQIIDIYPTYVTGNSFLTSAQFTLDKDASADAHGGFKEAEGNLMTGNAREEITGAMPLYLFPEHWQVAKRNIQPLFGFMCTLDVMGYAAAQYYTVPYLVLAKAA